MTAQDCWASWARPQLRHAIELAARTRGRGQQVALGPELYRTWFNPIASCRADTSTAYRPLAGVYRNAHAGSRTRVLRDGVAMIERNDAIGRDGWWRTWGSAWRPTQSRRRSLRMVMSPRPEHLADFVDTITRALLDDAAPWLLACTTDARRLRRIGSAVLHVPSSWTPPPRLIADLEPLLHSVTPPLCLALAPGIGLADDPDNGMSFGEHRCHLIALALDSCLRPGGARQPMHAMADVFASNGVDPANPHLSRPSAQLPSRAVGL